jgi:hypothetical protein
LPAGTGFVDLHAEECRECLAGYKAFHNTVAIRKDNNLLLTYSFLFEFLC